MSPVKDIEADLKEARKIYRSFNGGKVSRTFLTGANPFVLKYEKLMDIAEMIHRYFPYMETIGSFARVTGQGPLPLYAINFILFWWESIC
jgi:hypothetical protein